MGYKAKTRAILFTTNAQTIKLEFTWQNSLTRRLAALLYAQEDKPVDCEAIRQCYILIKENTGVFSTFRGDMALCVAAILSLSAHPQELFDKTLKVYGLLKDAKFYASDYLVIAAIQIAAQADPSDYGNVVDRTRAFYGGMKARHLFRTGQDDYIFTAMLGLASLDVEAGLKSVELLYNRFQDEFPSKNGLQSLAQILTLYNHDNRAANRIMALRDALRARKIKLDKMYTLSLLGILAMLPVENDTLVREIEEVKAALRAQKGFGALYVSTQELLLFAAALVASEYAKNEKDSICMAAISTSAIHIILGQQSAMIAAASPP